MKAYDWLIDVATTAADDCVIWPFARDQGGKGYGVVWTPRQRLERAHRVALTMHAGPPPDGTEALHSCDVKACVNPRHLSWGTRAQNCREAYERELRQPVALSGENHPAAKLTEDRVAEIIARYEAGGITQQVLGDEYGVSRAMIGYIVRGENWVKDAAVRAQL